MIAAARPVVPMQRVWIGVVPLHGETLWTFRDLPFDDAMALWIRGERSEAVLEALADAAHESGIESPVGWEIDLPQARERRAELEPAP